MKAGYNVFEVKIIQSIFEMELSIFKKTFCHCSRPNRPVSLWPTLYLSDEILQYIFSKFKFAYLNFLITNSKKKKLKTEIFFKKTAGKSGRNN